MNKKILKTISLMSLILIFTLTTAFADENIKVSQPDANLRASIIFEVHGGHGEWGYGFFNMWGKYWHTTQEHRVVLMKDNSYLFGAWEGAGATESYRDAPKGSNMGCTGEVR